MITLTDDLIRNAFDKLGIDEKFFSFFEKEVREAFSQSGLSNPDDEDTTEESLEEDKRDFFNVKEETDVCYSKEERTNAASSALAN